MKIAYCELLQHGEAFRKSKLRELAVQMNHQLEVVQISSTEESALVFAWSEFQSLVNDADSLFIPHGGVFEWPGMLESIQARIADGTRAILQLDENSVDVQNKFLESYDLTATRIRLRPYQPGPVPYRRENDCLRDFRLFAGLSRLKPNERGIDSGAKQLNQNESTD